MSRVRTHFEGYVLGNPERRNVEVAEVLAKTKFIDLREKRWYGAIKSAKVAWS